MVKRLYYELVGTVHCNVKFKSGGLLTRLTARDVYGLKPREIEWIYLVEQKRNATPGRNQRAEAAMTQATSSGPVNGELGVGSACPASSRFAIR
jgi:hypothetical protein